MSLSTLLNYLVGRRAAIERIVRTPHAIWLGALLVLAAGLAREYDAKDLLSEPWYLAVPLVASLTTSFLLYVLVVITGWNKGLERKRFWSSYLTFLSLYWMTAPLAFLYALPVDRFLSAAGATAANLGLLAIVSVWRVSLMTRVVSVYFSMRVGAAFRIVLLFADSLALVILFLTPLPIFNIMGGISITQSEQLILEAAFWVGCIGTPTWFLWFAGVCAIAAIGGAWRPITADGETTERVDRSLWCLAGAMILGWAFVLPFTQPEQRRRYEVEHLLASGQFSDAIDFMSRHEPRDFPPHWDPPPWLGYPNARPPLIDVLEAIVDRGAAPWVRAIYDPKLQQFLAERRIGGGGTWLDLEPADKDRHLDIFERWPVRQHRDTFERMLTLEEDATRQSRLRALIQAADNDPPTDDAAPGPPESGTELP